MKFNSAAVLSIVALLSLSTTKVAFSQELPQETMQQKQPSMVKMIAAAPSRTGNFQAGEHPTQGMVKIVTHNGRRYLEFDKSFKTDMGPDLQVILYKNEKPPVSGLKKEDYVRIASLQRINGTQRYAIPGNIQLANFKSVAVWCRKFNATFGFATLN
ncbi:MAG: DM13 domain-containing protein [Scytonematopsis contorta HA4267-MV1]|nr:DM13 domain-containing protein [Scytonematopsis contorta HA4267-MV1]